MSCVGAWARASSVEIDELAMQLATNWEFLFFPTRLDDQAMEVNGTKYSHVAGQAMEAIALQSAAVARCLCVRTASRQAVVQRYVWRTDVAGACCCRRS